MRKGLIQISVQITWNDEDHTETAGINFDIKPVLGSKDYERATKSYLAIAREFNGYVSNHLAVGDEFLFEDHMNDITDAGVELLVTQIVHESPRQDISGTYSITWQSMTTQEPL